MNTERDKFLTEAMGEELEWLHEQQAKPRKELFNPKEVLYDQNRSHNAGL